MIIGQEWWNHQGADVGRRYTCPGRFTSSDAAEELIATVASIQVKQCTCIEFVKLVWIDDVDLCCLINLLFVILVGVISSKHQSVLSHNFFGTADGRAPIMPRAGVPKIFEKIFTR